MERTLQYVHLQVSCHSLTLANAWSIEYILPEWPSKLTSAPALSHQLKAEDPLTRCKCHQQISLSISLNSHLTLTAQTLWTLLITLATQVAGSWQELEDWKFELCQVSSGSSLGIAKYWILMGNLRRRLQNEMKLLDGDASLHRTMEMARRAVYTMGLRPSTVTQQSPWTSWALQMSLMQ